MEKRIVAQLLTCIDDLDKPGPNVLLLGNFRTRPFRSDKRLASVDHRT